MNKLDENMSLEDMGAHFEQLSKMYDDNRIEFMDELETACETVENLNNEMVEITAELCERKLAKARRSEEMETEIKQNRKVEEYEDHLKKCEEEKAQLLYLKDEKYEEREKAKVVLKEARMRMDELRAMRMQLEARGKNIPALSYIRKILVSVSSLTFHQQEDDNQENKGAANKLEGFVAKLDDSDLIPFEYDLAKEDQAEYVEKTWDIINS